MHLNNILYRRNNNGQPCFWTIKDSGFQGTLIIEHGVVGKTVIKDTLSTRRKNSDEINSRINEKRKSGYKYITELKDNNEMPVEGELLSFLNKYLPIYRTSADGNMLPMLAKVYDNTDNKVFKKCTNYIGQPKINGLRCFIKAIKNDGDLFKPIKLDFQSREGTHWNSLVDLEEYLLNALPHELITKMYEEEYILDGELYLPGHTVNEINHFVKDPTCKENKLLQYWCYDIAIQSTIQISRENIRLNYLHDYLKYFDNKESHLNNTLRLICLQSYDIFSGETATDCRNEMIDYGFEGLILRNPNAEYQYGARNSSMIKYKRSTDGKFTIIDIYPEGQSRQDIPLIKLKNDINDAEFEVHLNGSFLYQSTVLKNKEKYIGKTMFVEYGERSGVNQVPFHVKETYIMN